MDLSRMRDILIPHLEKIRESAFFNGELGMVHGDHTVFSLLMRQKPPFIVNDHRFGLIMSGEAHISLNLQESHNTAGTLVYIGPGTIINPIRLSDDLRVFGIGLFADFPMPFAQPSTVRCATSSCMSATTTSELPAKSLIPSGTLYLATTTIGPPLLPSWPP